MKTPVLLIAAAAVFWGIEASNVIPGTLAALLISLVTIVERRFSLEDDDFVRISDLTSIIFLTVVVLTFLNVEKVLFLKTVVQWMPLVLLPLLLAQLYTGKDRIVIGTRFGMKRREIHKHEPLDFRYYYLGMCLISAAMANSRSVWFFPAATLLFFWLIYVNRGKSFRLPAFFLVFTVVASLGVVGFKGGEHLHGIMREKARDFFRDYYLARYADPFQSRLAYGTIGRVKSSDEILLRIGTDGGTPGLLRQASYELYQKGIWLSNQPFEYLPVSREGWELLTEPETPGTRAEVEFYLPREKGLLPHPYGSYRVAGENIYELEQKADGITRIVDGASLISYTIDFAANLHRQDDQPTFRNRVVGEKEQEIIAKIIESWEIETLSPRERVGLVEQFFFRGFTYSLDLEPQESSSSLLENFLLGDRRGYCEMYATATTLMLRMIGVPSRYVTGFVVAERSEFEDRYLVRDKHAHAWSEAYIDGRWLPIDTTPPGWFAKENPQRSLWSQFKDILSYYKLQFDHFRIRTEQNYVETLSAITVILAAILIYRIYRRMGPKRETLNVTGKVKTFQGVPSPFYSIEKRLSELGIPRYGQEHFWDWVTRIHREREIDVESLRDIYGLHNKLRFDPAGLTAIQTDRLHQLADRWLTLHPGSPSQSDFS